MNPVEDPLGTWKMLAQLSTPAVFAGALIVYGLHKLGVISFGRKAREAKEDAEAREEGKEAGEASAKQDQILETLKDIAGLLREQMTAHVKMNESLEYIKTRVAELFHWKPTADSTFMLHGDALEKLEARVAKLEEK